MENNNIRVYYAHSKKTYSSAREKHELAFIRSIYPNTICPNNDLGEFGKIWPYLIVVKNRDMLIVSEYKKRVGAGVFAEILEAFKNNIPVEVLRGKKFLPVKDAVIVDEDDWIVNYAKIVI